MTARYTRSDLTLANFFTTVRIILVPIFGWLWARGDNLRALWVFAVAAVTDVVDGFLARFLNQQSRLGALLDPIADKLLMLVALVVGVLNRAIPVWLAAAIIGRDAVLLTGALLLTFVWRDRHRPSVWRPTRIGKYAMFLQSISIVGAVALSSFAVPAARPWLRSAMVLTALLTLIAGAQYSVRAALALARHKEAAPS
jgi:cardiolipin synthase